MKHIVQNRLFFLSFQTEWKNQSYSTQWHTKSFQNMKLVSIYSKSVSHENSKCFHFPSAQMKRMVQNRPFYSLIPSRMKNESYLTQWHTKGFQNMKLVCLYSKSVSHENSRCLHYAPVQMKNIVQNRPFFLSFETERKNESYLTQWHTKYFPNITLVFFYSKSVSHENLTCRHFASVQMKHIVQNRPFYSLIPSRMKNWVIFDTMTYQRLPEYQISLYSKSVGLKNSKCLHYVSVQMKNSSKQAIFSLIRNRMKNESYLTQWHTKYFLNIILVSFYSKSVNYENSKCLHFVSVQVKHIVQNRQFYSLTRK